MLTRKQIQLAIDWCSIKYGKSNYHVYPARIRIYKKKMEDGTMASYNPGCNLFSFYLGGHHTKLQLCDSIIHEYVHFLQPLETYIQLEEYFGSYKKNPLEVDARKIAKFDKRKLLKHLNSLE